MKKEKRIGVYVCHCGFNIAKTVKVKEVAEFASQLPSVFLARDYLYTCSDPGQEQILNDIKDFNLNMIIVAACSPNMHEKIFRRVVREAGLNPFLYQNANIREHFSWVYEQGATEKAKEIVAAAVKRVVYHEPLQTKEVERNKNTLVVGGGIAGHNGLRSIRDHLKTTDFLRLRLGVGHPGHQNQVIDYVLQRASADEERSIEDAAERAVDVLPVLIAHGDQRAMTRLHTPPAPASPEHDSGD